MHYRAKLLSIHFQFATFGMFKDTVYNLPLYLSIRLWLYMRHCTCHTGRWLFIQLHLLAFNGSTHHIGNVQMNTRSGKETFHNINSTTSPCSEVQWSVTMLEWVQYSSVDPYMIQLCLTYCLSKQDNTNLCANKM